MPRHLSRLPGLFGTIAVLATAASLAAAQAPAPLPLGTTLNGQVSNAAPTVYGIEVPTAGVLSIAVLGDADLTLTVMDGDGQVVPEGSTDRDLFGSSGTEQLMVTLAEPGEYRIQVKLLDSGTARFEIGTSWIPMAALARPSDPDRRPSTATPLEVGRSHEDSLASASGDHWDWFVFTPATAGSLTVILRPTGETVDLVLEMYAADDLSEPVLRSDQDLQDNTANESGTLDVQANNRVFVKVLGAGSNTNGSYRISSSLIQ